MRSSGSKTPPTCALAFFERNGLSLTPINPHPNPGACCRVFHGEAVASAMGQSVELTMTHTVVNRGIPHLSVQP